MERSETVSSALRPLGSAAGLAGDERPVLIADATPTDRLPGRPPRTRDGGKGVGGVSGNVSQETLAAWMKRLGPSLIAHSASICRDRNAAEDIVQEAFVKLWKAPPEAGERAYPSWLYRVVRNLSINHLQRTRRPGVLPEQMRGDDGLPDQTHADRLERARCAMDRLDPAKREILSLRVIGEMSYEQIAEVLGVPQGTVMSRLNRARAALIRHIEEDGDDDEMQDTAAS